MKNKAVYALAFSPHAIDTEWGFAGTVAKWIREGKEVVYVVCTNGDKGSSDPAMKAPKLAKIREKEQLAAAKLLGVKEVIFLRHPDLGLEYTPELRQELLRQILTYRPQVVATCDPNRRYFSNPDHRALAQAVLDAVWPCAQAPNTFPELMKEGLALHKVKEVLLWQTEDPNYRIDITDTFELKKAAFACHKSQIGDPVLPEFVQRILERATTAAKGEKYKFGEAFHRLEVLQRL